MKAQLEQLATVEGVSGLLAHRGPEILWSSLPESLSPERATALCGAISSSMRSYVSAERWLHEAYFGFDGMSVLVVAKNRGESGEPVDYFLSFILNHPAATSPVSKLAADCLASYPEL